MYSPSLAVKVYRPFCAVPSATLSAPPSTASVPVASAMSRRLTVPVSTPFGAMTTAYVPVSGSSPKLTFTSEFTDSVVLVNRLPLGR